MLASQQQKMLASPKYLKPLWGKAFSPN